VSQPNSYLGLPPDGAGKKVGLYGPLAINGVTVYCYPAVPTDQYGVALATDGDGREPRPAVAAPATEELLTRLLAETCRVRRLLQQLCGELPTED